MYMYRDLFVCNKFGDSLPLGEFLQLPDAEKRKLADGRFNIYTVLERKLKELTKDERAEFERLYQYKSDQHQKEQKQRITTILRG